MEITKRRTLTRDGFEMFDFDFWDTSENFGMVRCFDCGYEAEKDNGFTYCPSCGVKLFYTLTAEELFADFEQKERRK